MAGEIRNFMGYLWFQEADGIITIGINEEGLEDFEQISTVELPPEGEKIEADMVIGTIETDDGPLDIYSPLDGTVVEVNSQVIEEPALIQEAPYEEGWLLRIETDESSKDEDEEDEDEDDDDDDEDEKEDSDDWDRE